MTIHTQTQAEKTENELSSLTNLIRKFLEDRHLHREFQGYMKMVKQDLANNPRVYSEETYIDPEELDWFIINFAE
ncbi:Uncharacterised protein [Mycobacteroides abscessus subsp. abscessus]|nr:Uncharacterised protein [Mycobacteroides abscessus subsp. abscessus]